MSKKRVSESSSSYWLNWYDKYARNQRTLSDIAKELNISKRTLQDHRIKWRRKFFKRVKVLYI